MKSNETDTSCLDMPHPAENSLHPKMTSGKRQVIAIVALCVISTIVVFLTTLLSGKRHATPAAVQQPTITTPAPAVSYASAPYGFLSGEQLRSPYSNFSLNVGSFPHGKIVFDPHTGQPFMVP